MMMAAVVAGHLDRVQHHRSAHVAGNTPPDDHPGERVDDEADVGHPGPRRHERQICDPQRVGLGRGEAALDEVGVTAGAVIATGRADPFGTPGALQAGLAHQPGGLVAADVDPGATGGLPQLPRSVDLIAGLPDLHQPGGQLGVASGPGRQRPVTRRVVAARSHLQHTQMGSTPSLRPSTTSSLLASMNATTCAVGGRAPPRRNSPHDARSRWRAGRRHPLHVRRERTGPGSREPRS